MSVGDVASYTPSEMTNDSYQVLCDLDERLKKASRELRNLS